MDSLSNLTGANDSDNLGNMFSLSYTQRMYAFIACIVVGILLSFLSTLFLSTGNIPLFAVLYSIGNIVSLVSTGFLIGFGRQVRGMFASTRVIATCVYLGCLVATFICAFVIPKLCFLFLILQFIALIWYSLSYIPYARDAVRRIFTN